MGWATGGALKAGRDGGAEAVCTGTVLDAGPEMVAMYGGPVYNGKIKPAIERLEIHPWGVRLRSKPLLPPRSVAIRDVRYEDITGLALLAEPASGRQRRGIRVQMARTDSPIYFITSLGAADGLIAALAAHGVPLGGQVRPRRLPYMLSYVYPDGALEPLPGA